MTADIASNNHIISIEIMSCNIMKILLLQSYYSALSCDATGQGTAIN